MATLFDKKERSPMSVLVYTVFFIALQAVNNNTKITDIPTADFLLSVLHIVLSVYVLIKGILLIKGTMEEKKKRTLMQKMQIVFTAFLMVLVVFVTIENTLHVLSYTKTI